MKKLLIILLCIHLIRCGQQPNYIKTVNIPDTWETNFFQLATPLIKLIKSDK